MNYFKHPINRRHAGSALLMSLVLLAVFSLLTLTALQGTVFQESMAGNYRDADIAFQSAETSARWGQAWLGSRTVISRPFTCAADCSGSDQVWESVAYPAKVEWAEASWWSSNARELGIDPEDEQLVDQVYQLYGVSSQPRFTMEQAFFLRDDLAGEPYKGVAFYRVNARGTGARAETVAVVESTVAKRYE